MRSRTNQNDCDTIQVRYISKRKNFNEVMKMIFGYFSFATKYDRTKSILGKEVLQ